MARYVLRRSAGEGRPAKPTRDGRERVRHEWREFRKAVVFWAVAVSLELVLAGFFGDIDDAAPLLAYIGVLTFVLAVWFVVGPIAAVIGTRLPGRSARSL